MAKTQPKAKVKKPTPTKPAQGLSQDTKNYITIAFLAMYFFIPILSYVGLVLMWLWTKWKLWIKIVITIPLAINILGLLFIFIYIFSFRPFQMAGDSMFPTYPNNAYVMTAIVHQNDQIKRNDVIIYKNSQNAKDFIKRVIGLPGETVMINDESVFINGNKLNENSYLPSEKTYGGSFLKDGQSVKVPANSYFVLGDNRPFSSDSRENGFVTKNNIISKVTYCYWDCK